MTPTQHRFLRSATLFAFLLAAPLLRAETYYIDNAAGRDGNDGLDPARPFRTIARAVEAAQTSDTISLANTGTPYREPIALRRLGGTPAKPFTIEGNGAVISGLRTIPSEKWTKNGDVHEIDGPRPYGHPVLLLNGEPATAGNFDNLAPGQWAWPSDPDSKRSGILRFRPHPGKTPADYEIEAPLQTSGLQVSSSSYLIVRNLVSEYHSNDGFNFHGECRSIFCENIEGRFNGDDGFSIHESIEAVVRNGHFHHNGSGIEDVNLSRSFYSGIHVHDNHRLGVLFIGAFHSAVDARVHDNPYNFKISGSTTKHLVGGEFSPIRDTSVYLQNLLVSGGVYGLSVGNGARVMISHAIISGSTIGIATAGEGRVQLTKSVVADCEEWELELAGKDFYGDFNIYHPGRFQLDGVAYSADQWSAFRKAAGHNEQSLLQDPGLGPSLQIGDDSLQRIDKHIIGPTARYDTTPSRDK